MGGKTSTTWVPGQTGNPKGRNGRKEDPIFEQALADIEKAALSHGLGDWRAVRGARNEALRPARSSGQPVGRHDAFFRAACEALVVPAMIRIAKHISNGGEAGERMARYVLDHRFGKPTETVKTIGDAGRIVVEIKHVDRQLVIQPPEPKALPDPGV